MAQNYLLWYNTEDKIMETRETNNNTLPLSTLAVFNKYGTILPRYKRLQTQGKFATGQTFVETQNPFVEDLRLSFTSNVRREVSRIMREKLYSLLRRDDTSTPVSPDQDILRFVTQPKYKNSILACVPIVSEGEDEQGTIHSCNLSLKIMTTENPGERKAYFHLDFTFRQTQTDFLFKIGKLSDICILFQELENNPDLLASYILVTILQNSAQFSGPYHTQTEVRKETQAHTNPNTIGTLATKGRSRPVLVFQSTAYTNEQKKIALHKERQSYIHRLAKDVALGKRELTTVLIKAENFTAEEKNLFIYSVKRQIKDTMRKIDSLAD